MDKHLKDHLVLVKELDRVINLEIRRYNQIKNDVNETLKKFEFASADPLVDAKAEWRTKKFDEMKDLMYKIQLLKDVKEKLREKFINEFSNYTKTRSINNVHTNTPDEVFDILKKLVAEDEE